MMSGCLPSTVECCARDLDKTGLPSLVVAILVVREEPHANAVVVVLPAHGTGRFPCSKGSLDQDHGNQDPEDDEQFRWRTAHGGFPTTSCRGWRILLSLVRFEIVTRDG